MFQRVADTVKIEEVFQSHGRIQVNTFHARMFGGYSESDVEDLAFVLDDAVGSTHLAFLTTEQSYVLTRVTGLDSETDFQTTALASAGPGVVTAVLFPANVSKAFTLRSALTGRNARGRVYYPNLNNNQVEADENYVTEAFVDDYTTYLEDYRRLILFNGWQPVIVSRFNSGTKRAEGVTFEWVSTGISSFTTDSMRGRLPK